VVNYEFKLEASRPRFRGVSLSQATVPHFYSLELKPPLCERTWMVEGASRRSWLERSFWNFWKAALSPCCFNACLSL
jgi:hypothetical protein